MRLIRIGICVLLAFTVIAHGAVEGWSEGVLEDWGRFYYSFGGDCFSHGDLCPCFVGTGCWPRWPHCGC